MTILMFCCRFSSATSLSLISVDAFSKRGDSIILCFYYLFILTAGNSAKDENASVSDIYSRRKIHLNTMFCMLLHIHSFYQLLYLFFKDRIQFKLYDVKKL